METLEKIEQHIAREREKHSLWAFLAQYGGSGSRYSEGYLIALEELEDLIKTIKAENRPSQLTLF